MTYDKAGDEVAGLCQDLEEAKKRVESVEGFLQEETTLRKHEEGLRREEALHQEHVVTTALKTTEALQAA